MCASIFKGNICVFDCEYILVCCLFSFMFARLLCVCEWTNHGDGATLLLLLPIIRHATHKLTHSDHVKSVKFLRCSVCVCDSNEIRQITHLHLPDHCWFFLSPFVSDLVESHLDCRCAASLNWMFDFLFARHSMLCAYVRALEQICQFIFRYLCRDNISWANNAHHSIWFYLLPVSLAE